MYIDLIPYRFIHVHKTVFCIFRTMATSAIADRIVSSIRDLWSSRLLSDVTLVADDKSFDVHRIVLAASSDYFMAMLTSNMQESDSRRIDLKGVTAAGLEPLLEYIYTGRLPVAKGNVCDVIMAATHLQMDTAIVYLTDKMNKIIDTDNCVDVKNVAKLCSLEDIEYIAEDYILDHFASVIREGNHCRLDLRALLLCYFHERATEADAVLIGPETKVFQWMLDWIEYGPTERMNDIARVMEVVRFPLMTSAEIDDIIKAVPKMTSDPRCEHLLQEARDYHNQSANTQVLKQTKRTRVRNSQCVFVISEHPTDHHIMTYALCFQDPVSQDAPREKAKWLHLLDLEDNLPDIALNPDCISSIVVNDFLVICSIPISADTNEKSSPRGCYLFDPRFSRWTKLASLNQGRCRPVLVVCEGALYALGGASENGTTENTDSIEKYDFQTDKWTEVDKMKERVRNHAACCLEGNIYLAGGRREDGTLSDNLFVWDPRTLVWSRKLSLPNATEHHSLFTVNDQMFMVHPHLGVIKTYQPDTQRWQKFWVRLDGPKLPCDASIVESGKNLVFVNGLQEGDVSESDSDDSDYERLLDSERACVEVIVGQITYGAGRAFVHNDYPSGLPKPLLLCGIRLPWHQTTGALQKSTQLCQV